MRKQKAARLLTTLDLGSGVAEDDDLLEAARIETSVFHDLLRDRVDLVPGTKGSGKTALYRMFVDFLPDILLNQRRVVIAHGVRGRHDAVFQAYKEQFDTLSEADFIDFWCVYLISLAYEQFLRSSTYSSYLTDCDKEVATFLRKYREAGIPEFDRRKSLLEIIGWALAVVKTFKPKVVWKAPEDVGQIEFSLDIGLDPVVRAVTASTRLCQDT
jgi:hypothetical protein